MRDYWIDNAIHITEWGRQDRPVIFCLHGLGSTALSFIEIAEELKDEFRIIAVDAPGHDRTAPLQIRKTMKCPGWLSGWRGSSKH